MARKSALLPVAGAPAADQANHLLSQLAVHERNAIRRASETQFYAAGEVLLSANTHNAVVFFPVDAVVSVIRPLRSQQSVEIGLVGSEGMVGLDIIMDGRLQLDDAVVQSPGFVHRMPAEDLLHQFHGGGKLQPSLLRFIHSFLGQVAQNVICNRYHALRPRLAKWLLMVHDRARTTEMRNAPGAVASALGSTESEIAAVMRELSAAGAVRQRSTVTHIERDALEINACECYETLRQEYRRTLAS